LFAVCLENDVAIIQPDVSKIYSGKSDNSITNLDIQFSPDDKRFIAYGENIIELRKINKLSEKKCLSYSYKKITMPHPIRKASFTPDGKLIIVAMANGHLGFCDGLTGQAFPPYSATWRCEDVANIDNQSPLLLYSIKNKLLFSLDLADHTDDSIYTFVIRDITDGRFLTAYNFYPNNPRAMGLTQDERSVVFLYNDNTASLLRLYTDQDIQDINFVENKANIYQLCSLFDLSKQFETQHTNDMYNKNTSLFVNEMRLMKLHAS
jgi:WD40 repeat protein